MSIASNMEAERVKRRAITTARARLRVCQNALDAFLSRYPKHAEAVRLYKAEIARLTPALDSTLRAP